MKLSELYTISFYESDDVIKAIDPEKAKIIELFNELDNIRVELHDLGVSERMIYTMKKIKDAHTEPTTATMKHVGRSLKVVTLAKQGLGPSEISKQEGIYYQIVCNILCDAGFRYDKYSNQWKREQVNDT